MKLNYAIGLAVRLCMTSALEQSKGNVQQAASSIGVHRTQFYKLAAKHGIYLRRESRRAELHA